MTDENPEVPAAETPARAWSTGRTLATIVLLAGTFVAAQLIGMILTMGVLAAARPDTDWETFGRTAAENGDIIIGSQIGLLVIWVPIVLLVGRSHPLGMAGALGLCRVPARTVIFWVLVTLLYVAAGDLLAPLFSERIPDFLTNVYGSASSKAGLAFAVVVVPALAEELLFRGFAYSALRSLGVPAFGVALVTAGAWAFVHVQYDLYWILTIFVGGLLLAEARRRTGSLVPAIAMHATVSAVGFAEVALAHRPSI